MSNGKVYLVGAGPGHSKLITVRGLECIQEADVVIYDRLANEALLQNAKKEAETIYCGKLPNHHTIRQEAINQLLVEKAREGKVVTRLKGGDPCVFGRAGEEASFLAKHGIPFEIVPGVTSGIAVPAYAGIPVTHREFASSCVMITGHDQSIREKTPSFWESLINTIDTIIFYMGVKSLPVICERLMRYGADPEHAVAVIEWGTTDKQRTVSGTLDTIQQKVEAEQISHPSIIVVGEVVRLREKMSWFQENARIKEYAAQDQ